MESGTNHNFLADTSHKCRPGWTEVSGHWIFGQVIDPRTREVQRWNRAFLITCLLAASIDPLFLYVLSVNMELACIYANQSFAVTVTIIRAFGQVIDPRTREVQRWNRAFLITCLLAASIDPLFLYVLSVNMELACIYANQSFAVTVTIIRAFVDAMYLFHMYLQLRLAYVSKESLVLGTGLLVWDARQVAKNYVCDTWAFTFDVFVVLPIPQFLFWLVVPTMIGRGMTVSVILGVVLALFLFQYIPRLLHMVILVRRMQQVTGYIFGTALWGFALNLIAYIVAAHIAGAIWYLLALNEMERCAMERCWSMGSCQRRVFGCPRPLSYGEQPLFEDPTRTSFAKDEYLQRHCLRNGGHYNFGIYHHAVPLPGQARWLNKILYPLFWGLMTLRYFSIQ
ncbi:hypothetical protein R1flu_014175 [Riccia fluitans]|uniref:Ion transport domain-containing protein n=1 Tax=Riccia fluitans TaxID=41844 RepID=A0ABD1YGF7_9MARC